MSTRALLLGLTLLTVMADLRAAEPAKTTNAPAAAKVSPAAPANVLTPARIAELRAVTEIAVSPDGQFTAFVRAVPRRPGVDEDGDAWAELWLLDAASGAERPYVTGKVSVQKLAWSADGQRVLFLAKRGDDKFTGLYAIPLRGGEAQRVFDLKSDLSDYSLAPDGQRVAALAADPEDEAKKKLKDKGFKQEVFEEGWRFTRVWVGTLGGAWSSGAGQAAAAEEVKPVRLNLEGSVRQVRWHPKEEWLAITITPTPSVDDGMMRQQIRVVNVGDGKDRATIAHAGKLGALEWSPDGQRLAFIGGENLNDPAAGRLFVAEAKGGEPRDVVANFEGEISAFAWSGADTLTYVAAQGVHSSLSRVSASGGSPTVVAPLGRPILTALSVARNADTVVVIGNSPAHPAEVFVLEREAGKEVRWQRRTDSNPWLAGMRFGTQEVVRHRARDGLDLEGVLIRPLNAPAGDTPRAPLILAVHGGPEAHISDGWLTTYSNPGQVAAARGFAVFYPNYRGSTGRGVAFSKLGQGDAAGREFNDLVDAVDHLIASGVADRARVGITGGSYGGYATAWCSTRFSDRFAAGVMFVGISDKISKVGTTDIPDEEYFVHARKRPWDDWQFLLERSPIFHAGACRTPLIILHGADDPRVNPGQSKELYRHLKLRSQAPVRLVLYPGEGHGNRKAAARYDYHLRMLQWFEHYLQGPGLGTPVPGPDLDYALPADKEK